VQRNLENNHEAGSLREHMMNVRAILGLTWYPACYRDGVFAGAMLAGVGFWLGLWLCVAVRPITLTQVLSPAFLALTIWHPLLEELLFRGYCQWQLRQQSWGQQSWRGLTVANSLTSLLFVVGHWWTHPPLWAIVVLLPSLVLGYCRDRYLSVYPCIVLHAFYNAGYFSLTGLP
jgi:membrane protease YdiL (CAAX protease family)